MKIVIRLFLCVLLLGLTPALFAQQDDPTVVGPTVYKKVFENDEVRVLEVNMKPGEKVASHSHPAHVAYVINAGKLKFTDSTGKSMEMDPKPGEALWVDAVTHSTENAGTTDLKVVIVELKKK